MLRPRNNVILPGYEKEPFDIPAPLGPRRSNHGPSLMILSS
jgi:hypothetical protein